DADGVGVGLGEEGLEGLPSAAALAAVVAIGADVLGPSEEPGVGPTVQAFEGSLHQGAYVLQLRHALCGEQLLDACVRGLVLGGRAALDRVVLRLMVEREIGALVPRCES